MLLALGLLLFSETYGQNPGRKPGVNTKDVQTLSLFDLMEESDEQEVSSNQNIDIFKLFDILKRIHTNTPGKFDAKVDSISGLYRLKKKELLSLFYNSFMGKSRTGEYSKRLKMASSLYKSDLKDIYGDYIERLNKGEKLSEAQKVRNDSLTKAKEKNSKLYAGIFEDYSYGRTLLFPTRFRRNLTRYFYSGRADRGVEILENNFFNINTELGSGSLYSEVLAGYLGPARISLGGMIATSELRKITGQEITETANLDSLIQVIDNENDQVLTTQSFLAGGGNALANVSIPWVYYHSKSLDVTFSLTSFYRFGFLLPEVGTTSDDIRTSSAFGWDFNGWVDLLGEESDFALFVSGMIQRHTNKENTSAILDVDNKDFFWSYEFAIGFDIGKQFRISFNLPGLLTNHPGEDPLPNTISLNLLPFK